MSAIRNMLQRLRPEMRDGERGFTLIELLVALSIFSVIVGGMFTFLWAASSNWKKGQNIADVTENARLGLDRMTRELRQSSQVASVAPGQVSFFVDFGNGPETVTYGFSPGTGGTQGTVWRSSTAGGGQLTLINDVQDVQFIYYGNDYRCDADGNGVITFEELQSPSCNGVPAKIARVDVALTLQVGNETQQIFSDQAWLRNRTV